MAAKKLSEITQGNPGTTDFLVGVTTVNQDRLFPITSAFLNLFQPLTLYIATTGNDSNDGRSAGTPFATFQRAFNELAKYNWAGGHAGTVNIANGTYNEQPLFTGLVGTVENQITWVGDISGSWGVQLKPTTLRAGQPLLNNAVIACVGTVGMKFTGLWLNAQDPGFSEWYPFAASAFSDVELDNCRFSVADNGGGYPYLFDHSTGRIGTSNYDLFGSQAGLSNMGQANFTYILGALQTLNTPSGAGPPAWSAAAVEIFHDTRIFWSDTPNWVGWGSATGPRFMIESGSAIQLFQADISVIPGNSDGFFIDGNTVFGANFTDLITHDTCPTTFGAVTGGTSIPAVGTHNVLFVNGQWQIFDVNGPQGGGSTSTNYWTLSFNDNGTGRHVPLSTKTTGYNYSQPTTGSTVVIGHTDGRVLIDPAGALLNLTVQFDANPFDGQDVEWIYTSQTITNLTVNGGGHSVVTPPTTLAAGKHFGASYKASNTTWYCRS